MLSFLPLGSYFSNSEIAVSVSRQTRLSSKHIAKYFCNYSWTNLEVTTYYLGKKTLTLLPPTNTYLLI